MTTQMTHLKLSPAVGLDWEWKRQRLQHRQPQLQEEEQLLMNACTQSVGGVRQVRWPIKRTIRKFEKGTRKMEEEIRRLE